MDVSQYECDVNNVIGDLDFNSRHKKFTELLLEARKDFLTIYEQLCSEYGYTKEYKPRIFTKPNTHDCFGISFITKSEDICRKNQDTNQ